MLNWLSKHKFQTHLTAFLLMMISSIGMLVSMNMESANFTWLLVAIFAAANILAVLVK